MSAPVDEFDLDIRLGALDVSGDSPVMFSNGVVLCLTESSKCSEYDCTTVNKTC